MAQPADVLHRFHAHVLQEFRVVERVDAAREDEVLPDQDAVPVAQVVEPLVLVEPAAPHPQHVLVRLRCGADQAFQVGFGQAGGERIGRDPVRPLGEERPPVHHERERPAPLVRLLPQFDRAQAQLVVSLVEHRAPALPVPPGPGKAAARRARSATTTPDSRFRPRGLPPPMPGRRVPCAPPCRARSPAWRPTAPAPSSPPPPALRTVTAPSRVRLSQVDLSQPRLEPL